MVSWVWYMVQMNTLWSNMLIIHTKRSRQTPGSVGEYAVHFSLILAFIFLRPSNGD